jgi:1,2-phenylacetyl-CoA epoxidase catalytic subunit
MNGREFVEEMHATLWRLLSVRDAALEGLKESVTRGDMPQLLKGALRTEIEASEIAALWVPTTPELEAKLAFARQAGDEAKHYMLIAGRLGEMGVDLTGYTPLAGGHSKLFRFLEGLSTSVERVAAAQFTREAIGFKSNELFIAFCEEAGDRATAQLYRTQIQPDEWHHHEWGKELLATLAVEEPQQTAARKAILTTLELAEELRSLAAGRLLVETLPGC